MMGQNGGDQNRLFYSFNLEDHVPVSHLLRGIDAASKTTKAFIDRSSLAE
jgi:hypothetical protein